MSNDKRRAFLGILSVLVLAPWYCSGELAMSVSPMPARIYQGALPDVTVVTVIASDNKTGRVTTLSLENVTDAKMFKIDSNGVIKTAAVINNRYGRTFTFAVYAHQKDTRCDETKECLNGVTQLRQVKIIVSRRNRYPPTFSKANYKFPVYRYGENDVIAKVEARDDDVDIYNKHFTMYAPPPQAALDYIKVSPDGVLTLVNPVSESMAAMMDVRILAVDSGSPQLTGTATVSVDFLEVKQPDLFCISSQANALRLCWKNPMPGQEFRGYNVEINNDVSTRKEYVPFVRDQDEACYTVQGVVIGNEYGFKVTVESDKFWYGDIMKLLTNHSGIGHHKDCFDNNFSVCSFRFPCSEHGRCMMIARPSANKDYTCVCDSGWQGDNCDIRNYCLDKPCLNGECQFKGHDLYECQCDNGYVGPNCQHLNPCLNQPCGAGGRCDLNPVNGTYTCRCYDGYYGADCQNTTPEPCSLETCVFGQGKCQTISHTESRCVCNTGHHGNRCELMNYCLLVDKPCFNNGECINTSEAFTCKCQPGTSGSQCDIVDPCFNRPCQNNGDCRAADTFYVCVCLPGFHGSECQYLKSGNCNGIDCHNGSCIKGFDQSLSCSCSDGFYGDFCEYYDVCKLSVPVCNHQGRCLSNFDVIDGEADILDPRQLESLKWKTEYTCECNGPWFGTDCQNFDVCASQTSLCMNGASCVPKEGREFHCMCVPGYYGLRCAQRDPCWPNPCENGATCDTDSVNQNIRCRCPDGYLGQRCQYHSQNCTVNMNPCLNSGSCIMTDYNPNIPVRQYTFSCECHPGYLGKYCQIVEPCHWNPCRQGNCARTSDIDLNVLQDTTLNVTVTHTCYCDHGYTGANCDELIDLCKGVTCLNEGSCVEGQCVCMPAFTGGQCEIEVPECITGQTRLNSSCDCINGSIVCTPSVCNSKDEMELNKLDGSVFCAKFPGNILIDRDMIFRCCTENSLCRIYSPDNCSSRTHCSESGLKDQDCLYFTSLCRNGGYCTEFNQINMSCSDLAVPGDNGWVKCASGKLNVLSSADPHNLGVDEVALYGKIVEDLKEVALVNKSIAQLAMDSISKLASVNISVSRQVEAQNSTNLRLRSFIDDYTASVPLNANGSSDVKSDVFTVRAESLTPSEQRVDFEVESIGGSQVAMSIRVPKKVLDDLNASRIQFVGFKKSQLFVSPSEHIDSDIVDRQAVISATVTNRTMRNMSEPVTIVLPMIREGENHTCVFWDPDESRWSTDGVVTVSEVDSGRVTCISNHLTSFAVLLSPSPGSLHTEEGLTYVTYIGCAISMACLAITLITYGLFRCLHGERSGKILLNLCTALLLLNAVFLAATINVSDYDAASCTIVALLLHYLVLASLTWMLVEAVEMHRAIVTVFAKYERLYLLKRCIFGWGAPALIVAITAAVDINMYGSRRVKGDGEVVQICFLSGGSIVAYYVSLLAPACLIIVINTIVFIMVARVILKPKFQQQLNNGSSTITPAQVRGALAVLFLLGITWVFGPLAIGKATVIFSYLFCICNSLQGCLIFIFRCLYNPEARLAWIQLFKTGTLKRRRGPIKSLYTDSSSSKAGPETTVTNRRLSNSTSTHLSTTCQVNGGTSSSSSTSALKAPLYSKTSSSHLHPHQLHNTNGWHPNLNGWRRENGHVINNPLHHTGFDLKPSDDSDLVCNEELESSRPTSKNDLVVTPDPTQDVCNDELTHL